MKLFVRQHFEDLIRVNFGTDLEEAARFLSLRRAENGLRAYRAFDKKLRLDRTHELLLASIAKTRQGQVNSILEFGTYAGDTTRVLRALFPTAEITTIDLPEPILTANDSDKRKQYAKNRRAQNIDATKANLILKDSITLERSDFSNHDLIWIDGDHSIPVIVVDILNSLRSLNEGGLIIVDDVCPRLSISNLLMRNYVSTDTWRVLTALSEIYQFEYFLFPKKLTLSQWLPGRQRYFALLRKK